MAGRTPLESAQGDEVVDAITDLVNACLAATIEPDEAMKSEKMRTILEETLPKNLVSDIFISFSQLEYPLLVVFGSRFKNFRS